jgi:peptidoglycan/LPS O-acetylase OafA/YrhL
VPTGRVALGALRWASRVAAAVVVAACVWWSRVHVTNYRGLGLSLVATCTACVIAAVVLVPDDGVSRLLSWRPLAELGKISYGVYLWHLPLFVVFRDAFPRTSNWIAVPIMAAITLGASVLSYRFIEEPFLRMKERFRPVTVAFEPAI